jgi:predicted benzoate:H+ symporter BenE
MKGNPMTTKQRIAVPKNTDVHGPVAPQVQVLTTTTGLVGVLDTLKGYYKGAITAITALLVIVNELTPVLNFLPGQDKQYVTAAIAFVGAVLTFLKDNEHWVDDA